MPEAPEQSMTPAEQRELGEQVGLLGTTGALVAGGVRAMLKKKATELADGILKAAGVESGFDMDNPLHVTYLQEFIKKAKTSCVDCWQDLDHVRKIASHEAMRETYSGLLILEKWANILEKTALLPDAQLAQLQEDPQMFQEFANLKNDLRSATLRGATVGLGLGGGASHMLGHNPVLGAVGGAIGGGVLGRLSVPVDLRAANIVNAAMMRQQGRISG